MKAVSALAVAALILAAAVVSMDLSGGPFHDVVGVVRSVGQDRANADGSAVPGGAVATVVLADGQVIQAAVPRPGDAQAGQSVHVRVFRRSMFGGTSYEVMRTKDVATK